MRASTNPQFLISGRPEQARSATALLGSAVGVEAYKWEELKVPVPTATVVESLPNTTAVREFCDEVSKLGAVAVMVEELDGGIQHITTFVSERSSALETLIYQLEARIIQTHAKVVLDFHLRTTPKDESGAPELPDGPYYLLTWRAA